MDLQLFEEALGMHERLSLGIVNYDLGDHNITQARLMVELGEGRWVLGRQATLKLVPNDYTPAADEQFVEEREDGTWVPERKV